MRVGGWNVFASMNMNSNSLICFVQGVKLLSLPRILCMNLKRFRNSRGSTRKLDCRVSFPETFDFSQSLQHVFSGNFAQVRPNSFLREYCIFYLWILWLFICFSSRMSAGTPCTQWSCTVVMQCLGTILLTSATGRTSAGTMQMIATYSRYIRSKK